MKYLILLLSFYTLTLLACSSQKETAAESDMDKMYLLIGSYSDGATPGISVYNFDTQMGSWEPINEAKGIINPSYLAVSPNKQFIYSVNETSNGAVSAFCFDKGALNFINSQLTHGADPCYININKEQTFIVTANYSGGSISAFPLSENGAIEPIAQNIEMNLSPEDSNKSHIHTVIFSPDQKYLLATDLGKDKIYVFRIDSNEENTFIVQEKERTTDLKAGSGPRHLIFHPNGKSLYCINELSGTVTVFTYHDGNLTPIQHIASDTTSGEGGKGSADIHISPDGKFLYSSNRLKNDGIAIFSINPQDGKLTWTAYQETGVHPRGFIILPNGRFLLCANRNSNQVQVFSRNEKTGLLTPIGEILVKEPVCLKWLIKD